MLKSRIKLDLSGAENVKVNLTSKVIRPAFTKANRPVLKADKQYLKAFQRTGHLVKAQKSKIKTYGKERVAAIVGADASYIVSINRGKGQILYRPSRIAHLQERAHLYLSQTASATQEAFKEKVAQEIRDGIQKLAP